jgi:hypothetical protein
MEVGYSVPTPFAPQSKLVQGAMRAAALAERRAMARSRCNIGGIMGRMPGAGVLETV